jgi:hypothetical protein
MVNSIKLFSMTLRHAMRSETLGRQPGKSRAAVMRTMIAWRGPKLETNESCRGLREKDRFRAGKPDRSWLAPARCWPVMGQGGRRSTALSTGGCGSNDTAANSPRSRVQTSFAELMP